MSTEWRGDHLFVMRGLENVRVEQLDSVEEARQIMTTLMDRNKSQGHLLVAWKRRLKEQNEQLYVLHREREEQMRVLTSQLLLLEANMRVKQLKIDSLLNQRDRMIGQQQETIKTLEKELSALRISQQGRPHSLALTQRSSTDHLTDPGPKLTTSDNDNDSASNDLRLLACNDGDESLDDSDSAVVIEDGPDTHSPSYQQHDPRNPQVKVIRSISDVVAAARANRCHRSDDDDAEADADADVGRRINEGQSESVSDSGSISDASSEESTPFNKRNFLRGSFERIPILQDCRSPFMVSTVGSEGPRCSPLYSRAVNNHRSVTKLRDIKSKKINKRRSSLVEESSNLQPPS